MKLFSGTANPELAKSIAAYLGVSLGEVQISRFPDSEIFLKVKDNIRGQDVYIIQPTCKPPNESLMELLIMIDAMKRASAKRITAVMPYYGYARQDRKDQPRVPITAKLVANLLVAAGANRILAMDLHAQQIMGFFDIPVDHLFAFPIMVKHLQQRNFDKLVVVSPDTGGVKVAYAYARMLSSDWAIVAKQRRGPTEVESLNLVGEVKGCTAVMVDDMVTTAGTLCAAAKMLKAHGAKDIYAAVSHATLTPVGVERLKQSAIKELIVTDSVPLIDCGTYPVTVLSVAELLGEAIRRINDNQSVTSLFRLESEI